MKMKNSGKQLFLRITFPFLDDYTLSMDGINDFWSSNRRYIALCIWTFQFDHIGGGGYCLGGKKTLSPPDFSPSVTSILVTIPVQSNVNLIWRQRNKTKFWYARIVISVWIDLALFRNFWSPLHLKPWKQKITI